MEFVKALTKPLNQNHQHAPMHTNLPKDKNRQIPLQFQFVANSGFLTCTASTPFQTDLVVAIVGLLL